MTENIHTIHQKSINNAISAYFMILVSGTFLLNKDNPFINNAFVRGHTKVALIIHIGFVLCYLLFSFFGFLRDIFFLGYGVNYILTSGSLFLLFCLLLYGVYMASQGKTLGLGDIGKITKTEKIIDINGDNTFGEKDIFTLILCHIPFIGYMIYGRYHANSIVKNISYINLLLSLIIIIIYIFGYANISLLLILGYIILAVFSCINIISSGTVIQINLSRIPKPEIKISMLKAAWHYSKMYFQKKDFVEYKKILTHVITQRAAQEKKDLGELNGKKIPAFLEKIIYIPFLNIINLGQLHSSQKFHVRNGLMITLLAIGIPTLSYFYIIPQKSFLLLLFPICFGYGFLQTRPSYRMPYVYEIYELLVSIKNILSFYQKTLKEKKSEVHSQTQTVSGIPDPNKK